MVAGETFTAEDRDFTEMERDAELGVAVAEFPDTGQGPGFHVHVALEAHAVVQGAVVGIAEGIEQGVDRVLREDFIDQQRGGWIGLAGGFEMLADVGLAAD